MNTIDTAANDNQNPDSTTRAILCIILIIIIMAMSSCSIGKNVVGSGGAVKYISDDNGYISFEAEKILVSRQIDQAGTRALSIRSWGFDGQHFEAEEGFLAERPELISELKAGKVIYISM